ncbi:hypothetical protein MYAM1_000045 [Malassezia yamatoensis]|uniref:Uncharacterized protein n=1 Tax=Malassezia yamatoensis TaxID=253288 RepID=A0AAJ5YNM9_9BASI|nr:hypothetical protein MYAM1_000045 [Malassezia yamatoensis]
MSSVVPCWSRSASRRDTDPLHDQAVLYQQYITTLQRLVAEARQDSLTNIGNAVEQRWRLEELQTMLQRAEHLRSVFEANGLTSETEQAREVVDRMLTAYPLEPVTKAKQAYRYWDDYLYNGLERKDTPLTAQEDHESEPTSTETDLMDDTELQEEYSDRPKQGPIQSEQSGGTEVAMETRQSDKQIKEALSSELLRMARVLRRNTAAFGEALERDRVLVEQAGTRLDQNLSLMTRTRGQLGVFSKKARSMGWFTLLSMAMVFVSWVAMYIVIRLT